MTQERRSEIIHLKESGILGRGADADYKVENISVSRHHCHIYKNKEMCTVHDLNSRYGTYINNKLIKKGNLSPGDILRVGVVEFQFIRTSDSDVLIRHSECNKTELIGTLRRILEQDQEKLFLDDSEKVHKHDEICKYLQQILVCESISLIELSDNGDLRELECGSKHVVLSRTVLRYMHDFKGGVWAPREINEKSGSLAGLPELSIYCKRILDYSYSGGMILFYAYWPEGCIIPSLVEELLEQLGDLLAKWAIRYWQNNPTPISPDELSLPIIGKSQQFRQMLFRTKRIAITDYPVVLIGERGTGKSTFAQLIHKWSRRKDASFCSYHCANLLPEILEVDLFGSRAGAFTGALNREGVLKQYNGGTVLLDSLESCPLQVQSKLLDVVEKKAFRMVGDKKIINIDIRFIASVNEDPDVLLREKRLRPDFWDRLAIQTIYLVPLRQRREDISLLAEYFLQTENQKSSPSFSKKTLTKEAIKALEEYSWPGNVRELENVIKQLLIFVEKDTISAKDVRYILDMRAKNDSLAISDELYNFSYKDFMEYSVKRYVQEQLKKAKGNISRAAANSKLSRKGFYDLLKRTGYYLNSKKKK